MALQNMTTKRLVFSTCRRPTCLNRKQKKQLERSGELEQSTGVIFHKIIPAWCCILKVHENKYELWYFSHSKQEIQRCLDGMLKVSLDINLPIKCCCGSLGHFFQNWVGAEGFLSSKRPIFCFMSSKEGELDILEARDRLYGDDGDRTADDGASWS